MSSEYIQFGQFNSSDYGLYLLEREAPTPAEKVVTENLSYANGILDFSSVTGERFFDQRSIAYQFRAYKLPYSERKLLENKVKRLIMSPFDQRLYDSHDKGYYWVGKAKSVKVDDDATYNTLTLNIEFDLYPFAIKNNSSIDNYDDWDTFDFDNDFIQPFSYQIDGKRELDLMNVGENSLSPTVVTSDNIEVVKNGRSYMFSPDKSKDYLFSLERGNNHVTIKGNATVRFVIQSEVLL
ncbi:hypothetical protein FFRU_180160 [Fructobacillus fructosus]|uniref:hypothetical protein n=1 Tax=Fructobacillus fructosus TaxID=1631 RepID=UPI0002195C95|nr:hypothetical protein [Fructobacillus fructosus]KRN51685.1 prophage Lp1 protein 51 [Fructobacillus fructosus KCTC 3544]GAP01959.1 hypothetical protein FFRU_180160 [Fructobacillus fructosus]